MKTITLAFAASLFAAPALAQESAKALQDAFAAAIVAEDAEALGALYTDDALSYGPDGGVADVDPQQYRDWGVQYIVASSFHYARQLRDQAQMLPL